MEYGIRLRVMHLPYIEESEVVQSFGMGVVRDGRQAEDAVGIDFHAVKRPVVIGIRDVVQLVSGATVVLCASRTNKKKAPQAQYAYEAFRDDVIYEPLHNIREPLCICL